MNCIIWAKISHEKALFTITGSPNIHFLKFWAWHFKFSNFQTTFVKIFTKKPLGFKIGFESTDKFYLFTIIYDLKFLDNQTTTLWFFFFFFFYLKFARKSLLLLKVCQMREILKPRFCWYFWNILLWVILMKMKVSQVGCLQITGRWICYSIFFDISYTVFFTRLLSKGLSTNYPFSAQISKIHFKI